MYAALDDPQEYLIHDVRFHRTIARAAGNPILGALMETITANLYDDRSKTVQHSQSTSRSPPRCTARSTAPSAPTTPPRPASTMEQHLNLARMAQAAEADHPPTEELQKPPTTATNPAPTAAQQAPIQRAIAVIAALPACHREAPLLSELELPEHMRASPACCNAPTALPLLN